MITCRPSGQSVYDSAQNHQLCSGDAPKGKIPVYQRIPAASKFLCRLADVLAHQARGRGSWPRRAILGVTPDAYAGRVLHIGWNFSRRVATNDRPSRIWFVRL